uniref:Synembryn n=1 Tax=Haemonchus contortus TaxID=6289 RepID=A0A7I4YMC0_HAECO
MNSTIVEQLRSLLTLSEEEACRQLQTLNAGFGAQTEFQFVDASMRQGIAKMIESSSDKPSLRAPLLELIRILARDKRQLDVLLTEKVRHFIICASGHSEEKSEDLQVVTEADKCLVNTLFNSSAMRQTFEAEAVPFLLERISSFTNADYSGRYEWINSVPEDARDSLWLFDLRIAFLISAHSAAIQSNWGSSASALKTFLDVIRQYIAAADELEECIPEEATKRLSVLSERAGEAAKVIFNITYKRPDQLSEQLTNEITEIVCKLMKSKHSQPALEQHAVNLLSTLKLNISMLCPKMNSAEDGLTEQYDLYDMSFAQALLDAMEKKLDDNNNSDSDLLSTYLGSALKLCTASKEARRYCRLKILPPLVAADVARRPDEGDSLRNKIVRVMMSPAFSKDLASEFMFVLCKRSVSRLIKYTGLGHSAGLLANCGLLGHINLPKSASDSEDSETEEYKAVEDRINPVTGYLRPENPGVSPFEGMSEEQKEYEAMKLVDAMNKLMNTGVVKPGTIGEDGRPKAVGHVLELVKDVPDEEPASDSE